MNLAAHKGVDLYLGVDRQPLPWMLPLDAASSLWCIWLRGRDALVTADSYQHV